MRLSLPFRPADRSLQVALQPTLAPHVHHVSRWHARAVGVVALALATATAGCSRKSAPHRSTDGYETVELRYQATTGNVSVAELAESLGYLAPIKLTYVGNTISGPQDIQTVATGDADFGGAFNGAIVKLVAAKVPIKAVIGYYGVDDKVGMSFYTLEQSPIRGPRDLIGKKIGVNTLGAHSEFMVKEYLARQGLTAAEPGQVTLVVVPPISTEYALRQKQIDVAALSSIFKDKALARGGLTELFSDYQLFGTFTAGSYVMTDKFLRENPRTARKFVEAAAKAIEWTRTTPRSEVVARFTQIIEARHRAEDTSIVQYWQSTGIAGRGGLIAPKEFDVWIDWLVKDHQLTAGEVTSAAVYTNELNPYASDIN